MASLRWLRVGAVVGSMVMVAGFVSPAEAVSPSPSPSAEPSETASPVPSPVPTIEPSSSPEPTPTPEPVAVEPPADSVVVPAVGTPLKPVGIPDPEADFVGAPEPIDLPEAGVDLLTVAPEASATDEASPAIAGDSGMALAEPVWSELVATAFEGDPWATQLNTGRPDLEVSAVEEAEAGEKVLAETIPADTSKFLPGAVVAWELSAVAPDEASTWAAMTVDYAAIGDAFGGDYGQRLQLMAFPACALTTPTLPECVTGVPLETTHHEDDTTMSAVVPLEALEPVASSGMSAPMDGAVGGGSIIAAVSGASGSTGTFTQTPSTPDGTWGVPSSPARSHTRFRSRCPPLRPVRARTCP